MTIPLKRRTDALGEFESGDVVPIEHGGTGASSLLDAQESLGVSDRLLRSEYVQHFRGVYTTLDDLQTAVPTAIAGDNAHVDSGAGSNVQVYLWDVSDAAWQLQQTGGGSGGAVDSVNGKTGIVVIDATDVGAPTTTDFSNLEQRVSNHDEDIGNLNLSIVDTVNQIQDLNTKTQDLQNQIDNLPVSIPTWYDITTLSLTTMHPDIDLANTKFEVAKINGLLCIRGYFKVTADISGDLTDKLFVIKDPSWIVDVSYMPLTTPYLLPIGSHSVGFGDAGMSDLIFSQQSGGADGVYATISNGATVVGNFYNFAPYCLGKAL